MSAHDPNQSPHSDYDENVSVVTEHAAAASREKPDQAAGTEPVSLWAFLAAGIALVVGGGYLGATSGGFGMNQIAIHEDYVPPAPPVGPDDAPELPPEQKWLKAGKKVYSNTCAACHLANGQGQEGQFPPLAGSEWVTGGTERLSMITLNGLTGPIVVKGKAYSGVISMQAWKASLSDLELAQVLSYIRSSWGNENAYGEGNNGYVLESMIKIARERHGDKPQTTVSDLEGIDDDLPGGPVDSETMQPVQP